MLHYMFRVRFSVIFFIYIKYFSCGSLYLLIPWHDYMNTRLAQDFLWKVFSFCHPLHVGLSYHLLETCNCVYVCVCMCTRLAKHETARGEDWRECLLCFLKQTLKADEWYQEVRLTSTRLNEKLWGRAFFFTLTFSFPACFKWWSYGWRSLRWKKRKVVLNTLVVQCSQDAGWYIKDWE